MAPGKIRALSSLFPRDDAHARIPLQEVTPLSTPPRSLVQLFTDWDLPEKVVVVRYLGTGVVSRMPVITDRLVGGEEAALKMWELLVLMGKEGIMFHSAAMASGNFWDVLTEAELIIEGLGQHKKFRDLYRDVEQGPLNHYFTGHLGPPIKWGFTSLRQAREAIPSREPGQFFDFMAKSLAFLVRPFIRFLAVVQWLMHSPLPHRYSTGRNQLTLNFAQYRKDSWRTTRRPESGRLRESRKALGTLRGRPG